MLRLAEDGDEEELGGKLWASSESVSYKNVRESEGEGAYVGVEDGGEDLVEEGGSGRD